MTLVAVEAPSTVMPTGSPDTLTTRLSRPPPNGLASVTVALTKFSPAVMLTSVSATLIGLPPSKKLVAKSVPAVLASRSTVGPEIADWRETVEIRIVPSSVPSLTTKFTIRSTPAVGVPATLLGLGGGAASLMMISSHSGLTTQQDVVDAWSWIAFGVVALALSTLCYLSLASSGPERP